MPEQPSRTLVFVYGTLKRGGTNHAVLADQEYLGDARTPPGYRLYVVADYPGLIKDPRDQRGVMGEIWSVDAEALDRLDMLEGVEERLYRRDVLPVLPPYHETEVQGYYYLRNTRGRRPIIDGVWPVRGAPPV
jgi:gamma-glutamylcyclotransferase (GGCT)/AIG2-like uncharacterized protein YtfP